MKRHDDTSLNVTVECALVARAMCKPRDGRFQSAAEMLAAMEAVPRPWLLDDPAFADTALSDRSGNHNSMAPTL